MKIIQNTLVSFLAAATLVTSQAQQEEPCVAISDAASQGTTLFPAHIVHECLASVPLNTSLAKAFVNQYTAILSFQSTQAWLKDPPSTYRQQPSDVIVGLQDLVTALDNGTFTNEYDFEDALQSLLHSAHDGHLYLNFGVTNLFSFSLPVSLVSIGASATSIPKVYPFGDINIANQAQRQAYNLTWSPSALKIINNQDAIEWLEEYAAEYSNGYLEPNVDWNNLFPGAAASINGAISATAYSNRYVGQWFNVTFDNGTSRSLQTIASLKKPLGNVTSSQDIYDKWVAIPPGESNSSSVAVTGTHTSMPTQTGSATAIATGSPIESPTAQASNWREIANLTTYPDNPDIIQPNLGNRMSWVTGYFYPSQSLAVISIPSFDTTGDDAKAFSKTVSEFISKASSQGLTKVIIDVQSNGGGSALMSYDMFEQFFPNLEAYGGSRMRAQKYANLIGEAASDFFENGNSTVKDSLVSLPFVAESYINAATNKSFASWAELSQNYSQKGDLFTITARENFSNPLYDLRSTSKGEEGGIVVSGYANNTLPYSTPPFDAANIVVLFDGQCASTCTTMAEQFIHIAGVHSVTMGGKPESGPMQGVGGVRGALSLEQDTLTELIEQIAELYPDIASDLPDTTKYIQTSASSFNLRDQVRKEDIVDGQENAFPRQFAYEPSECRLFYTAQTVNNYSALWLQVADVVWGEGDLPSKCVAGSTGQLEVGGNNSNVTAKSGDASNSTSNPSQVNIAAPIASFGQTSTLALLVTLSMVMLL